MKQRRQFLFTQEERDARKAASQERIAAWVIRYAAHKVAMQEIMDSIHEEIEARQDEVIEESFSSRDSGLTPYVHSCNNDAVPC